MAWMEEKDKEYLAGSLVLRELPQEPYLPDLLVVRVIFEVENPCRSQRKCLEPSDLIRRWGVWWPSAAPIVVSFVGAPSLGATPCTGTEMWSQCKRAAGIAQQIHGTNRPVKLVGKHLVHVHGECDIGVRICRSAEGDVLIVITINVGLRRIGLLFREAAASSI